MKFEILIFIAILISCHYKLVCGADPSGSPQSTGGTAATLDIKKSSSTNELDYSKDGDYRTYSAKDTHTFCKIVKGNNDIWTVSGNDDAVKVVLKGSGKNMKQLLILLKSGKFVFLYKSGKSGICSRGSKKPCWNDITSTKPDITKLKFYGENDKEITSSGYKVSIVNLSYIYEFSAVNCLTIRLADKVIWKSVDDANYKEIKAFSIDLSNAKFTITNGKNETKEVTGPEGTGLTLDIKKNISTPDFKYLEYSKSRSFAAKDNKFFSKIVGKNGTEIWSSKDNDDAVKVVLKGKGDSKKHLALLLKSCKLIVLYRENKNSTWTDITSQKHDVSKLKFLGENDTELKPSDYKIDIGFTFSYLVILNGGVRCNKVKFAEADLWKSTDDKKFEKLKSFTLDLELNNFHVRSEYETKKLDFTKSNAAGTGTTGKDQTGTGTTTTDKTGTNPSN